MKNVTMNEGAEITMDGTERLHRRIDHLEWANRRALQATRAAVNEEALRLLSHLLASERVWLHRLERGDSAGLEIWPELSLDECADLLSENVDAFRGYLGSKSGGDLDRDITYLNSAGREFQTPIRDVLLHVVLHGSYHRGQIAARLRDAGGEPINTDFITFVREQT